MITGVGPGDVLAIRTDGLPAEGIRLGAELLDKPSLQDHIAVLDHPDANGTWWCIEGRPSGVGWRVATDYLASPYTVTNRGQPKTAAQRAAVCKAMRQLLGTPYDWRAITEDGEQALHLFVMKLWQEKWVNGVMPAHVVCSSAADWAYAGAGLEHPDPGDMPHVTPASWVEFILTRNYELPDHMRELRQAS